MDQFEPILSALNPGFSRVFNIPLINNISFRCLYFFFGRLADSCSGTNSIKRLSTRWKMFAERIVVPRLITSAGCFSGFCCCSYFCWLLRWFKSFSIFRDKNKSSNFQHLDHVFLIFERQVYCIQRGDRAQTLWAVPHKSQPLWRHKSNDAVRTCYQYMYRIMNLFRASATTDNDIINRLSRIWRAASVFQIQVSRTFAVHKLWIYTIFCR